MAANIYTYLNDVNDLLSARWPDNRTVNIVAHGHSVPSGYCCTPYVDPFSAYPHLLHRLIKERFPYAVTNMIVTAIGGENSKRGAARFDRDVLCHRPDVLLIDYGLNDRSISMEESENSWRFMIESALKKDIRVILLTPSWDQSYFTKDENWHLLEKHCLQIRQLADEYTIGLSDSFEEFRKYVAQGGQVQDLLNHVNHPSRLGHRLIAQAASRWFIAR